jgi:membrane protease YdiL (CAAX protease family)
VSGNSTIRDTLNPAGLAARPPWIAAPWHTLSVLAVLAGHSIYGAMVAPSSNAPAPSSSASDGSQVMSYIFMIGSEVLLATWIWAGVQWKGGRIRDLIGGRWSNWGLVLRDVAIALPFWVIWEATARFVYALLYPHSSPSNAYHVPTGPAEIFLWLLVSLAAGFCEELVFRGYLQRQFHAATGSIAAAVVLQAIVFGLVHSYQGWKPVLVITVLGVLYGTLVALRRDLPASMIAHAWSDIYEGYAKFLWLGRP